MQLLFISSFKRKGEQSSRKREERLSNLEITHKNKCRSASLAGGSALLYTHDPEIIKRKRKLPGQNNFHCIYSNKYHTNNSTTFPLNHHHKRTHTHTYTQLLCCFQLHNIYPFLLGIIQIVTPPPPSGLAPSASGAPEPHSLPTPLPAAGFQPQSFSLLYNPPPHSSCLPPPL